MAKYQFTILALDRIELRSGGADFEKLNDLGAEGWRVVQIREEETSERNLSVLMEREIP